jgi:hypothetical protein
VLAVAYCRRIDRIVLTELAGFRNVRGGRRPQQLNGSERGKARTCSAQDALCGPPMRFGWWPLTERDSGPSSRYRAWAACATEALPQPQAPEGSDAIVIAKASSLSISCIARPVMQ